MPLLFHSFCFGGTFFSTPHCRSIVFPAHCWATWMLSFSHFRFLWSGSERRHISSDNYCTPGFRRQLLVQAHRSVIYFFTRAIFFCCVCVCVFAHGKTAKKMTNEAPNWTGVGPICHTTRHWVAQFHVTCFSLSLLTPPRLSTEPWRMSRERGVQKIPAPGHLIAHRTQDPSTGTVPQASKAEGRSRMLLFFLHDWLRARQDDGRLLGEVLRLATAIHPPYVIEKATKHTNYAVLTPVSTDLEKRRKWA